MDDTEDDDFGGFEVADADAEPILSNSDLLVGGDSSLASGPDVSSIPWLAATLQLTSNDFSNLSSNLLHSTADDTDQSGKVTQGHTKSVFIYMLQLIGQLLLIIE